eukprot:1229021-Amphidinium_carterae.2
MHVCGYRLDVPRALELSRDWLFVAVAELGNRLIFILGDWNSEPDKMPVDVVYGSQRPQGHQGHI